MTAVGLRFCSSGGRIVGVAGKLRKGKEVVVVDGGGGGGGNGGRKYAGRLPPPAISAPGKLSGGVIVAAAC